MVIFGAGASHDSLADFPWNTGGHSYQDLFRPPLANQLFGLREQFNPFSQSAL